MTDGNPNLPPAPPTVEGEKDKDNFNDQAGTPEPENVNPLNAINTPTVEAVKVQDATAQTPENGPVGSGEDWDPDYDGDAKEVEQNFTYAHNLDPARQALPGGTYLDQEERKAAEIKRAALEDREPDLEHPPSTQGTPLLPTHVAVTQAQPGVQVLPDVTLPVVIGTNPDESEDDKKSDDEDNE